MSKASLTITLPDGSATPYELVLSSVTVGRGLSNTCMVPDESVAEAQFELSLDVTGYVITDLAGDGSTLLNGYPLEQGVAYQVESGSVIRFGGVEALYECEVAQAAAEPTGKKSVAFPEPGSFERPEHPAGVFVRKKAGVNVLQVVAVVLAVLSVLAAAYFGFSAGEIGVPR